MEHSHTAIFVHRGLLLPEMAGSICVFFGPMSSGLRAELDRMGFVKALPMEGERTLADCESYFLDHPYDQEALPLRVPPVARIVAPQAASDTVVQPHYPAPAATSPLMSTHKRSHKAGGGGRS